MIFSLKTKEELLREWLLALDVEDLRAIVADRQGFHLSKNPPKKPKKTKPAFSRGPEGC